ncbi:MAG TPA: hypothetical protein VHC19_18520, partial [Pirellulales bacterium]|nr:hypothetical protein [Pirellulales bacterium]
MFFPNSRRRLGSFDTQGATRRRSRKWRPALQTLEPRSLLSVTPQVNDLTAAEAADFSGAVATFTAADAGPFTTRIDWGDGSITDGAVSSGGGVYTVSGSHAYAAEGSYDVSVVIVDDFDSSTASAGATATVTDSDFLTPSPGQFTLTGMEGTSLNGNVGLFADTGYPTNDAANFTSTIDWGDGTTTAGTVSGPATTALDMLSEPGDYVGGGATYHFTPATGAFHVSHSSNDNQITFDYGESYLGHSWSVTLAAPNGQSLVPGVYDNAGRAAFRPPDQPGLDVYGDGRGSNTLTGSFDVK